MTPDEFISWLAPVAQPICNRYRLYARISYFNFTTIFV